MVKKRARFFLNKRGQIINHKIKTHRIISISRFLNPSAAVESFLKIDENQNEEMEAELGSNSVSLCLDRQQFN